MSTDSSVTVSTGSKVRQFGLYRTIDAKTEDFLRLSKKRQIRQGCACAAVSTAIAVTIVVVILLIYEYVIAVEWNSMLNNKSNIIGDTYINDQPTANRLYRSYFGLDQDYYERMPLLVNSMQENSYIDPSWDFIPAVKIETFKHVNTRLLTSLSSKSTNIKKTSPRPFYHKTSTPLPLSKKYGSRSWVEKYRNAQRLQNIRQVIKYLEKTINAKVGDMHTIPPNSPTVFSGLFTGPMIAKDQNKNLDLTQQDAISTNNVDTNHYSDPLVNYTPDSPAQVNLLADPSFKLSHFPIKDLMETITQRPLMFRRLSNYNNNCDDINKCKGNVKNEYLTRNLEGNRVPRVSDTNAKLFNVMPYLFPLKSALDTDSGGRKSARNSQTSLDNIYFTTSRPIVKFKRKPTSTTSGRYLRNKPRYVISTKETQDSKSSNVLDVSKNSKDTNMIVHTEVHIPDVYPEKSTTVYNEIETLWNNFTESPLFYSTFTPVKLSSHQVEDYHAGSSGVIPVVDITTTPTPTTETVYLFSTENIKSEAPRTNPTDIFTFSHEDAKIPKHYLNEYRDDSETTSEIIEKWTEKVVAEDKAKGEVEMLIIKLKNNLCNNTRTTEENMQHNNDSQVATIPWTYVPQTNGHYRSRNPYSLHSDQLSDSDYFSKIKDNTFGRKPLPIPTYIEIIRNYTKKNEDIN